MSFQAKNEFMTSMDNRSWATIGLWFQRDQEWLPTAVASTPLPGLLKYHTQMWLMVVHRFWYGDVILGDVRFKKSRDGNVECTSQLL